MPPLDEKGLHERVMWKRRETDRGSPWRRMTSELLHLKLCSGFSLLPDSHQFILLLSHRRPFIILIPPSLLFHQPSPLLPFNDRYAHIKMSLNAGWKCAVALEPHRRPEPEQTSEKHLNVKQMFCKTHASLHFVEPFLLLHPPLVSFFLSSVHTSLSLSVSLSGRGLISEIGQDIFWPISLTFRSVGLQRGSVPARKKHKTHKSKNLGERLGALGQREATSALPLYSIAGTSHFEDLPLTATAKLPTSNHTTSP